MRRVSKDDNLKCTFKEELSLTDEDINEYDISLYHGIRFDAINRLESIFQTGFILPSNKVNRKFVSFDGTVKYLYINDDIDENCNRGKYISVLPFDDDLEYHVFILQNIFFAIKASVDAYKTKHVSYDEYLDIENKDNSEVLYSYAFNEYLVDNDISLDNINYIGIDSRYFNGNYEETVESVINLMKVYKIKFPFIDVRTNSVIFSLDDRKLSRGNH